MVALQGYVHLAHYKSPYLSLQWLSLYIHFYVSSILILYLIFYKMGESPLYIGEDPLQHVATNYPSVWPIWTL